MNISETRIVTMVVDISEGPQSFERNSKHHAADCFEFSAEMIHVLCVRKFKDNNFIIICHF